MADLSQPILLAEALATLFHPFVEVVVHDIPKSRIAAIFNSFSHRSLGDDSRIQDATGLSAGPDVHGPFEQRTSDGRRLKYISIVLRDADGSAAGLLCVNLDVSSLEDVGNALEAFLSSGSDPAALDHHFHDDWQTRIRSFVNDYLKDSETTIERIQRRERSELVEALYRAGAFRAKNAAGFIANVLGVSRATVYNDLSSAKLRPRPARDDEVE